MTKFIKGFVFAFRGIAVAVKEQRNLKVHLLALVGVILVGLFFSINTTEWGLIFLTFGLVIVAEMINTAIEYLVDFVSPEHHELAGKVKDVAAGAVLISAIIAVAVGISIFGNKILNLLL